MKSLKLMVDNTSYQNIAKGKMALSAYALNDYVSTTRRDANRQIHMYESRHSITRAFMRASVSKICSIVSSQHIEPIRARIAAVGQVHYDGVCFMLDLYPVDAESRRAK